MAKYRKFIIAGLGALVTAAVQLWGSDAKWGPYVQVVVAIATAAGVFGVRNAPAQ